MESRPEIFFSYAWGDPDESGTSREKIVNDLYDALVAAGFNVIRDKNDLRYKGLISGLTQRIGRGKFIVVAISDKYLKSTYCMSELLEIYRRSNSDIDELLKKIFPIVLEDAKIYEPEDRVDYLEFWENKKDELNKELKGIELENASTFADDLRMYDEITSVIPILSRLLKDMNTLNLQKLSADNFAEIKTAIIKAASTSAALPGAETIPEATARQKFAKFTAWHSAIVLLFVTGLLALFLHLGHVSTTAVRMEFSVSEISFNLPQEQVITNILKLSSIGASGLENVAVTALPTTTNEIPEGSSSALISIDSSTGNAGTITLDALPLPAGVRIGIRATDVGGEYRLSLSGKPVSLPVQVNGLIKLIVPPNPVQELNIKGPGVVRLQSGGDGVDLDLNFLPHQDRVFTGAITADSISLMRIEENHSEESSLVRSVSTILSGTIYYESIGGKKRIVQPGQYIECRASKGKITSLDLSGDHITVTFVGNVRGMTAGGEDKRVNLMPTYLQWLNSRVSVYLLLGIVILLVGLTFGLSRFRTASI